MYWWQDILGVGQRNVRGVRSSFDVRSGRREDCLHSNCKYCMPHRVCRGYDILSVGQRAVRDLHGRRDVR